jgi:uncharacterized protein (TIGR00255 family)
MMKSMTGYGRAEGVIGNRKFTVELKSLNSKQFDLNVRMPSIYKEKEIDLRNWLTERILRGKVDVSVFYEAESAEKRVSLNKSLMLAYFQDLKDIAESVGQQQVDYMSLLMRIPDAIKPEREELDENEWSTIMQLIQSAERAFDAYRVQEGNGLSVDFEARIAEILAMEAGLDSLANARIEKIRERIQQNLEEVVEVDKIDRNRFEQELIYYIEKIDVNEERSRLIANCNYFLEILRGPSGQGKKLGFIAQEIGREINTLGSKANDSDMQRIVVQMKDELEKIKEQVLNVL